MQKYHRYRFVFVGLVTSLPLCAIVTRQSHNILIGGEQRSDERVDDVRFAKVADFGTARILEASTATSSGATILSSSSIHISSLHVTQIWAAPELLRTNIASTQADVYSFGVVLWELLQATGEIPFSSEMTRLALTRPVLIQKIMANEIRLPTPSTVDVIPKTFVDLVASCTSFAADQRPSFNNIHQLLVNTTTTAGITSSFVFSFSKPSSFFIKYIRNLQQDSYGDSDDIIEDFAVITTRNSKLLVVLPQRRFASLIDAEQNRDQFLDSLPDIMDDDDDDEELFANCRVESMDKFGFLKNTSK